MGEHLIIGKKTVRRKKNGEKEGAYFFWMGRQGSKGGKKGKKDQDEYGKKPFFDDLSQQG